MRTTSRTLSPAMVATFKPSQDLRWWLGCLGPQKLFLLASLVLIGGKTFGQPVQCTVDYDRSYIAVRTDKGGLLSAFGAGHKHGIFATKWSADVCFDPQNVPASHVAVTVSTQSLRIDTPEAREKAGLDPDGPSENDVPKIQEKMLSSRNLAANDHPNIEFRSTSVKSSNRRSFILQGTLTIRGKRQIISLPVSFEPLDNQTYHFSGQFPVKQTRYGIKPESVGGVVNVKDEVAICLDIYAISTTRACKQDPL